MDTRSRIDALIAQYEREAEALATLTPKVLDGHSDGKRVRYVRLTERAAALRDVLAMLSDSAGNGTTTHTHGWAPDARCVACVGVSA